jgi:excisionase family DNA binding protein
MSNIADRSREFLSVQEVAEALGVSELTVRRRIQDGSLPTLQIGGPHTPHRIPSWALTPTTRMGERKSR